MTDTKTAEQLAGEVKAAFDAKHDQVKALAEEALGKAQKGEDLSAATKQLADEALVGMNEAKARLDELEQKIARKGADDETRPRSIGEQVLAADEMKAFLASRASRGRASVEVKAIITSLTTDAMGSAGDLIVPDRLPGILAPGQRRLTVRDLLTPGRTSSTSVQYVKETGFTNAAATVSETTGALKPQSDIKFDIATSSVTTIAHWVLATRQILDDAPMLQSYIDGRLRYGLALVEENQLLNGGGTGTDLNGIYTQATAFTAPITIPAPVTRIDVLRLAVLKSALAELPTTGAVLHPSDWASIELLKETTGAYLIGNPQGALAPTLWSLPIVATQAISQGNFLAGAFRLGAQIFDRWDARVEVSTEDDQNFRKNLVTILAEERLALAVYRPEAFVKGAFAAAATAATAP
ncbi:phage major capsid protein [Phenylobacterium sp.]|jgi:HK97 family phage major capsid protein|uniref:phage major capsid protein n=1 Tax=Phenylobacterium sp. TaxID=1871053 RepID=UPI0022C54A64|nr:phage major capsid protein [Phenylobacterium sp.]MCA6286323.1 phage major capsid protein [Phenylobacterium sp.]MCA6337204.1 phage major capsid protein [Phenylobacterium sp.]MCA6361074.1 phage major capsid protein [Phenylobacterium sp.]MCZ8086262.1 phage major capsid protein [Brevundimonas sp.]